MNRWDDLIDLCSAVLRPAVMARTGLARGNMRDTNRCAEIRYVWLRQLSTGLRNVPAGNSRRLVLRPLPASSRPSAQDAALAFARSAVAMDIATWPRFTFSLDNYCHGIAENQSMITTRPVTTEKHWKLPSAERHCGKMRPRRRRLGTTMPHVGSYRVIPITRSKSGSGLARFVIPSPRIAATTSASLCSRPVCWVMPAAVSGQVGSTIVIRTPKSGIS